MKMVSVFGTPMSKCCILPTEPLTVTKQACKEACRQPAAVAVTYGYD